MHYETDNVALTAAGDFAGRDTTDACYMRCFTESRLDEGVLCGERSGGG